MNVNNFVSNQVVDEKLSEEFKMFWARYENAPLVGRNILLSAFCPKLYGLFIVKLGAAIVLAGGVSRTDPSGTRVRGESHMV